MATETTKRPIVRLLADIVSEVTELMETELRLVRAEINGKISSLASSGTMIGIGAVLLIAGLGVAFFALVEWLVVAGLAREWALTLVAACGLVAGGVVAARGVSSLKASELLPERSLHNVRQDFRTIKEHVS